MQSVNFSNWLLLMQNHNTLNISFQYIDDNDLLNLCDQNIQCIRRLRMRGNNITEIGIGYFSRGSWAQLTELILWSNKIGNRGCKYLSRTAMAKLKLLNLDDTNIGHEGILHLSKSQWNEIENLCLKNNTIHGEGCLSLAKANWSKLVTIDAAVAKLNWEEVLNLLMLSSKFIQQIHVSWNLTDRKDPIQMRTFFRNKFGKLSLQI